MTKPPSTLKSSNDATVTGTPSGRQQLDFGQAIMARWAETGQPDLVAAIEEYPDILTNKALLLSLALEEYDCLRKIVEDFNLKQHCGRFQRPM